jgi:enoyl-CoA hydratase
MDYNNILYVVEEKIAFLTINRPKRLNALNVDTIEEIGHALARARNADEVRVIILTG